MKKITLVSIFSVLVMFAFNASAAVTLSWVSKNINSPFLIPPTATVVDPLHLTGHVSFNDKTNQPYIDTWVFNVADGPVANSTATVLEFFDADMTIKSILLDGINLTQNVISPLSLWFINGPLSNGDHTLKLNFASVDNASGQYDVKINATPIPAAVWLFGSALLGVGGLSSRRKSLPAETLAA